MALLLTGQQPHGSNHHHQWLDVRQSHKLSRSYACLFLVCAGGAQFWLDVTRMRAGTRIKQPAQLKITPVCKQDFLFRSTANLVCWGEQAPGDKSLVQNTLGCSHHCDSLSNQRVAGISPKPNGGYLVGNSSKEMVMLDCQRVNLAYKPPPIESNNKQRQAPNLLQITWFST